MVETVVALVLVPSFGDTALLLGWGICIGGYCNLLKALIGIVTFDSTFKTSYLRLVLGCYRHNIASSSWGSVGVVGDIVVVELGWCTVEIVVVVVVTSMVVVVFSGLLVSSIVVWTVCRNM